MNLTNDLDDAAAQLLKIALYGDRGNEAKMTRAILAALRAFAGEASGVAEMPVRNVYEQRLRAVLDVVQRYLPPDGIATDTAMGEIIGLIDPWPDGVVTAEAPNKIDVAARAYVRACRKETSDAVLNAKLEALFAAVDAAGVMGTQGDKR